jgi:hypothetical protein
VSARFKVLDARQTPMGVISLRRRHDPVSDSEVYEAKLDDEFLMSSLFVAAEVEVARLALLEVDGDELDVVVGGLGLGYTAHTLLNGDFFALARGDAIDGQTPGRTFDAVVVDIDHSPRELLHPSHADFYKLDGVRRLAGHLRPGGVFGLWSNDPPDEEYEQLLATVFADVRAEVVRFPSALPDQEASNTVYVARRPESA